MLQLAFAMGDWGEAESLAKTLNADHGPRPDFRWALVAALKNQGRLDEAWSAMRDAEPLEPRNPQEAKLWMGLNGHYSTAETDVMRTLTITRRFREDEDVLSAAILAVMRIEQRVELAPSTIAETQLLTTSFVERFPDSKIFRKVQIDDPAELQQIMKEQLEPAHRPYQELREAASAGQVRVGFLAAAVGRPYGEALVRRAAGFMVIYDPTPAVMEHEWAALRSALNRSVAIDTAAIHTLSLLPRLVQEKVFALFHRCEFSGFGMLDLHATVGSLSMRSQGTFVWDPASQAVRAVALSQEDSEILLARAQAMVGLSEHLSVIGWNQLESFSEIEGLSYSKNGS